MGRGCHGMPDGWFVEVGAFWRLLMRDPSEKSRGSCMVGDLRSSESAGAEPELDAFARHVDSDQQIEILRMEDLRAELPRAPAEPGRSGGSGAEFAAAPPRLCIIA